MRTSARPPIRRRYPLAWLVLFASFSPERDWRARRPCVSGAARRQPRCKEHGRWRCLQRWWVDAAPAAAHPNQRNGSIRRRSISTLSTTSRRAGASSTDIDALAARRFRAESSRSRQSVRARTKSSAQAASLPGKRIAASRSRPPRAAIAHSVRRLYAQHGTVGRVIRHEVEQLVRSLANVANTLAQIHEKRFATKLFHVLVEQHALEPARARNLAVA